MIIKLKVQQNNHCGGFHPVEYHYYHGVGFIGDDVSIQAMQAALTFTGRNDCVEQAVKMERYLTGKYNTSRSYTFSGKDGHVRIEVITSNKLDK